MGMKYVIIGGGIAGVSAAETIRANSSEAEICILEAGEERPYLRPLLSKTDIKYLNAENIALHPAEWYERKQIQLKTDYAVTAIHADEHFVTCRDGSRISYDKLICAMGAFAAVPPIPGADHKGVHTVRSIADMKRIHRDMAFAENAVVVGGGGVATPPRSPSPAAPRQTLPGSQHRQSRRRRLPRRACCRGATSAQPAP